MNRPRIPGPSLALALALVAPAPLPAQEARPILYEAFYLEDGVRNLRDAADRYRDAAELAAAEGDVATEVKARLGLARCLQALGASDAAGAELERALRLDPDSAEARAALERRERTDGIDPELSLKIRALVQKLGGAEREQAAGDLRRIGALAAPFLADGLRSREVAVVQHAALLLAESDEGPALDVLDAAFADEDVLFPHLLVAALRQEVPDVEHPIWRRIVDRPASPERQETLDAYTRNAGGRLAVADRLRRLLADDDPAVRRETLEDLREPALSALLDDVTARLGDGDDGVRVEAVDALGKVERDVARAAAPLIDRLGDESFEIRSKAAAWIARHHKRGQVDDAVAFAAVSRLVQDEDLRLVEEGVEFLRRISGPWPDDVRSALMGAIDRIASSPETRSEAGWLLDGRAEFSDAELTRLFHAAEAGDWTLSDGERAQARLACARTVASRQPDDAARLRWMAETFAETDDAYGQRVLLDVAYGMAVEPHARAMLLGAASEHPRVRREAYEQLAKKGNVPAFVFEALPHLPADLVSSDDVAGDAYRLAEPHPRPEWEEAAAAFHAKHRKRNTLRFLIACSGDAGGTARALDAVRSGDAPLMRVGIDELVGRLEAAEAGRLLAEVAVGFADPFVVFAGHGALAKGAGVMGVPQECVAAFVAALPDEKVDADTIRHTYAMLSPEQLERVVSLGLAGGPDEQHAACVAVAGTAYEPALDRLVPLLDSPRVRVRDAAAAAVDAIRERIERRTDVELLGPGGKAASIARARDLLESDDPVARRGGALALGALGDASVVPLLLDLLGDEDPAVREAALKALEGVGAARDG
ncbi:MAG: HEAT repeat domain-containing protein [Planctomycetota bacterium JB042]